MYRMSMWTWGVGGTNWEIKTDVCALPCDDLEGRDGAGWDAGPRGRGHTHTHTHTELIHFVVEQKLIQHCKTVPQ